MVTCKLSNGCVTIKEKYEGWVIKALLNAENMLQGYDSEDVLEIYPHPDKIDVECSKVGAYCLLMALTGFKPVVLI